jgi:hypothetical protein
MNRVILGHVALEMSSDIALMIIGHAPCLGLGIRRAVDRRSASACCYPASFAFNANGGAHRIQVDAWSISLLTRSGEMKSWRSYISCKTVS